MTTRPDPPRPLAPTTKHPVLYQVMERIGYRSLLGRLYRVELLGAERIPLEGATILTPNHESMLDPWLLGLVTRRPIRFMAKAELWRYPGVRWVMEKFGVFPVERGSGDRQAVGRAAQLLANGELLGIFPQGTCLPFRDRRWYRGAAKLALATGATVVPVCIVGSERALRPGKFKIGFPRVRILIGHPIAVEPGKPTLAAARALTDRIKTAVEELRHPYGPPAHAWYPQAAHRLTRPVPWRGPNREGPDESDQEAPDDGQVHAGAGAEGEARAQAGA
jgi:1-acyl-sn-glycerol-3-phosphate acyltransferase